MAGSGQTSLFPAGRRRIGRVRRGLDQTVKAMRDTGRIEAIDAGLLALARVAADELDAAVIDTDESRFTVSTLIGRYGHVLEVLTVRPDIDDTDDSLAALFAGIPDDATAE